jgi:hypothetical protein
LCQGHAHIISKFKSEIPHEKEKPKLKMTPKEMKAFRVELMAKARAAKKIKRGE